MLDEAAAHEKHAAKKEQTPPQSTETRITDPDRRESGEPNESIDPHPITENTFIYYVCECVSVLYINVIISFFSEPIEFINLV